MFRQRYNEITRKRWYDVAFLVLLSLSTEIIRLLGDQYEGMFLFTGWISGRLSLLLAIYLLVNELTHRHRQAFVTAAILGSVPFVFRMEFLNITLLWSYSLLSASIFFFIKAFRRFGAQWKNITTAATLLSAAIIIGGIWPFFHYMLPFFVVSILVIRPIITYKKQSIPAAILLIIVLITASFYFHPNDFLPELKHELNEWEGNSLRGKCFFDTPWLASKYFVLVYAGLWFIPGITALIYAFRSQRTHGDLAALIGVWWYILAYVLLILRPANDKANLLTIFIPMSFYIGAYFNLLTLPKRLNRIDRRTFRTTLFATSLSAVLLSMLFLYPFQSQVRVFGPFALVSLLLFGLTLYIIARKLRKQRLSVHRSEVTLIVMSILLTASLMISIH